MKGRIHSQNVSAAHSGHLDAKGVLLDFDLIFQVGGCRATERSHVLMGDFKPLPFRVGDLRSLEEQSKFKEQNQLFRKLRLVLTLSNQI